MTLDAKQRTLLDTAFAFANLAHADHARKVGGAPYICHSMQVAGLVLEFGGNANQAAAALLHDVVEDTATTLDDIEDAFGKRIATIVDELTDTLESDTPDAKSPWAVRKRQYLDRMVTISDDAALIAGCDKLHNLTGIVDSLRMTGPSALDDFSAPDKVIWFYSEALERLDRRLPDALRARYRALLSVARKHIE